jgi:hypothetical protein
LAPHGNFGSPDFSAANPRYTEVRLSAVGMLAAAAERGEGPPVPIGMVNGDLHADGLRPPFNAVRVLETLTALVRRPDLSDDELVRLVGAPEFPTGCRVEGDLAGLAAGEPATLTLRAHLTHEPTRGASGPRAAIVVTCLPPMASANEVAWVLSERAETPRWQPTHPDLANRVRIPLADVVDATTGGTTGLDTRLVISLHPDGDPTDVEAMLDDVWGIKVEVNTRLPAPLPDMLRQWVARFPDDELLDGLARLRALL